MTEADKTIFCGMPGVWRCNSKAYQASFWNRDNIMLKWHIRQRNWVY